MDYDDITHLLCITDPDAFITKTISDEKSMTEFIFMDKKVPGMYCPSCGLRMHSKGVRTKRINHPALQTGYKLILYVTVHKWICKQCGIYDHDHYSFVEDGKRNTSLVPFLVLQKLKKLEVTARHVAEELNVSDTYVFETFMRNVNLPRLPFPEILSIDEVYLKFDESNLYGLTLMDFKTGQIIDILPNRYKETYEDYFLHIPLEERKNVKILVSDIYKPYLKMPAAYFPEAESIIDSFHVVSLITSHIKKYVSAVKNRYKKRDKERLEEKNYRNNSSYKTMKKSWEVKLLEHYDWFLLKNKDDIDYSPRTIRVRGKLIYFNPKEKEKELFSLDPNFEEIRDMKERYIEFNKKHINDIDGAEKELREIIEEYESSHLAMYREIARTLKSHIPEIAKSFTYIAANDKYHENSELLRRISNGPIEGFNVKPKNLKRISRGVSNYEYARNRILWATREDPHILAVPRSRNAIHKYTGKKRGKYNKKSPTGNE